MNLYGASTLDTELSPGHRVVLQQGSEYPWNGRILLAVKQCDAALTTLHLRIPGWAKDAALRINGRQTNLSLKPGTYVELRRKWVAGDRVELDLPMPACLLQANPRVEETLNQVAVRRGPLIYCLETARAPAAPAESESGRPDSSDNRTIGGPRDNSVLDITVPVDTDLVARFDRRLLGGVTVIDATGFSAKPASWDHQLYREVQPLASAVTALRFVPYFAWGNRGPGEMSVWIPLAPRRLKN